jgi:hypothetical protein
MPLFARRETPPDDALGFLDREERVLSWADTDTGRVVLATPRGVWWPDADGYRLIGWQFVDKAIWREGVLTVVQADVLDDLLLVDRPPVAARLATPRDLPPTVRKRIEANVVRSELVAVPGGAARLVARRVPGHDGLTWLARLEAGAADSPQLRVAVEAQLAVLRAQWEGEQQ